MVRKIIDSIQSKLSMLYNLKKGKLDLRGET